jgi:hypothetical protein
MLTLNFNQIQNWLSLQWLSLSFPSKILITDSIGMICALTITFLYSFSDERTIREVGIWVKPMKFMAATALFGLSTVWLIHLADSVVDQRSTFYWITSLIILTSLFEVAYISFQAFQGAQSHYNISDSYHAFMFGLMALAAIGLVASQAWLAWEIWKEQIPQGLSAVSLAVILGLALTFILSFISGFLLGGHQPPPGQGLPIVGWHLYKDIRPSHFLGVHAQQIIPLFGLFVSKYFPYFAVNGIIFGSVIYSCIWIILTLLSI